MKTKKHPSLIDLYETYLSKIDGIKFTRREIDIIAFIVSGRSAKKIASFLSLSSKTVENYTHNIMVKLGCNSREVIIDFIERSGVLPIVRIYYSNFLDNMVFEKYLKNISLLKKEERSPTCLIISWESNSSQQYLIDQLVSHLNLAGVSTTFERRENISTIAQIIKELHENSYVIYTLPAISIDQLQTQIHSQEAKNHQPSQKIPQAPHNKLFLFLESEKALMEIEKCINGFDHINVADHGSYYSLGFNILKKILPNLKLEGIIEEFEANRRVFNNFSNHKSPEVHLLEEEKPPKIMRSYVEPKIRRFLGNRKMIVSVTCLGIAILSIGFLIIKAKYNNRNSKLSPSQNEQISPEKSLKTFIRSDLIIPKKSVLLDRFKVLNQIKDKFNAQSEEIQTIALVGIGGIGKTTLARQYAQSQTLPVIWEINAETKESLVVSLENLADAISKTEEERKKLTGLQSIKNSTEKEEKIIRYVKEYLRLQQNWLLIYDNVENFADIYKYFPHDSAIWGKGKIILTTRNSTIQNNKDVNYTIYVDELTDDEKLNLFLQIIQKKTTSQTISEEDIKNFLKEIPSFPLDISIAAYYIKSTNISFDDYLNRLKYHCNNFSYIQKSLLKEAGDYQKTRYEIITLSLKKLIETHSDFSDLLLFLSLLDSNNIPRELLSNYKSKGIVDSFIYNLNKYSLITSETSNSSLGVSFSIHRSTQEICLKYITDILLIKDQYNFLNSICNFLVNYVYKIIENEDIELIKILFPHYKVFLMHENIIDVDKKIDMNINLAALKKLYRQANQIKTTMLEQPKP